MACGLHHTCPSVPQAKLIQDYCASEGKDVAEIIPQSFAFYPAKPGVSEEAKFVAAAQADPEAVWILKPSDGAKGTVAAWDMPAHRTARVRSHLRRH